jgi:glutamyl-tRNA synthetase
MSAAPPKPDGVVTRFAPSPTGYLHIGGARTALYNWLYARKHGGRFLLRIEDTDRERSTDAAVAAIFDGLGWLGLMGDGEPLFQFARAPRHAAAAEELVARGGAYRCFLAPEEEAALKEAARAEGRPFRSPWRDRTDGEPAARHVVRLKAPSDGDILIDDQVQGTVRIAAREIDDLILLRSDGTPTYMLAVVVDDHDMGVTHVIRGDDHLVNAARQTAIIQGFGWQVPVYAHIPLIHGPDGAKLSKRHGALGVDAYRDMGFLPEAMLAYLLRLGWSKGDLDILTLDEAIAEFDLSGVNKAPGRLDFAKMESVNAHFIRRAGSDRLAALTLAALEARGAVVDDSAADRVQAGVGALKERAKTVLELADQARFLLAPDAPDEKAAKLIAAEGARARLARLEATLTAVAAWDAETLKAAIGAFAASEGVGFGQVGPLLRAALTGGAPAPDLGVAMALLGREECLARIAAHTAAEAA